MTNDDESKRKKQRVWCILLAFLALLITIAIAFGILIIVKQSQSGDLSDDDITTSETAVPSTPPSSNILTSTEIKEYLVSIMAPISGAAGARVFDRNNKDTSMDRFFALEWL